MITPRTPSAPPGIDRLAREGMRFDACFCTNSICSPSRATILTGAYPHVNGVTTLDTPFDARQPAFPGMLRDAGYQTAIIGKWHLGHGGIHDPAGFDHWSVLPDQGDYHGPTFLEANGRTLVRGGYATDLITDLAIEWIAGRDTHRPFLALVHHKAPHRSWEPAERHASWYLEQDLPEPATFRDDYVGRAPAAERPKDWRTSMYYRYWMHLDSSHSVRAHRGVRTERHKLVHYYEPPEEWELFELTADPFELHSIHAEPAHRGLLTDLRGELDRLALEVGDSIVGDSSRHQAASA